MPNRQLNNSILFIFLIFLVSCNKIENIRIADISIPQWQQMSIKRKAKLILETAADNDKNQQAKSKYLHIQTLISLSPPLSPAEWNNLELAKIELLKNHPEWGDYKQELVLYGKKKKVIKEKNIKKINIETVEKKFASRAEKNSSHTKENISIGIDNPLIKEAMQAAHKEHKQNYQAKEIEKYITIQPDTEHSIVKQKNLIDMVKTYTKINNPRTNSDNTKGKAENITTLPASILYTDGEFPSGKYLQTDDLKNIPYKTFEQNYYLMKNLVVKSYFNNGYICESHDNGGFMGSLFESDDSRFFVKFPYPTSYLKNGSILYFSIKSPLKIESKIKIKSPTGKIITRYNCLYRGKTVHAIK